MCHRAPIRQNNYYGTPENLRKFNRTCVWINYIYVDQVKYLIAPAYAPEYYYGIAEKTCKFNRSLCVDKLYL